MSCARGTTSGVGFVTRGHWLSADCGLSSAEGQAIMSTDSDMTGTAAEAAAAPLDLLLTDAVFGALRRVNPGGSGVRLAAALATRPRLVAGRGRQLLGEMASIAVGRSEVQPSRRDHRFADPGWTGNPLLRRAMQAYLAAAQTAEGVVADTDLDWADSERVGFALRNLVDALAPSNNPVLNSAALKTAIDTGGASALARWIRLSGAHHLWLTMRLCIAVIDEPVDDSFLSRRTPGGAMAEAGRNVRLGVGVPTRTSDRRCRGQLGQAEGHGIRSRRTSSCRDTASCSPNRGTARQHGAARPRPVAPAARGSRRRVPSSSRRTCPRLPLPRSPSRRCASASHSRRGNDVMLRRRALAGSRAVLADLRGPRAGALPSHRIRGSELQLIAGAGHAFPLEVRERLPAPCSSGRRDGLTSASGRRRRSVPPQSAPTRGTGCSEPDSASS